MTNDQAKAAFIDDLKAVLKKHNAEITIENVYNGIETVYYLQSKIRFHNGGRMENEFIDFSWCIDQNVEPKD